MEKIDYKELIAADPGLDLDGLALSPEERRDAEALKAEMQALDVRIGIALDIETPALKLPELPPVDMSNVAAFPEPKKGSGATMAWLGLAASVLLVAGLGSRFLAPSPEYGSLAEEVVAHLDHEPGALVEVSTPIDGRRLARVADRSGVDVADGIGLVTYAQSCVINGKTVPHLVIQGQSGPVTLLLMPEEMIKQAQIIDGQSINGVVLPVGSGSIAIIGEKDEDIDAIEKQVVDSVTWSI